jgi:hypothetical protein
MCGYPQTYIRTPPCLRRALLGKGVFLPPLHPQAKGAFVPPVEPQTGVPPDKTEGVPPWTLSQGAPHPLEPRGSAAGIIAWRPTATHAGQSPGIAQEPCAPVPGTAGTVRRAAAVPPAAPTREATHPWRQHGDSAGTGLRGHPRAPRTPGTQEGQPVASGSNTRKRKHQTIVRWDDPEWDQALAKADAMGLSLPAALRSIFLDTAAPAPQKRTPVQNKKISELFGHCGKIGSNLKKISRVLDESGQPKNQRLQEACAAYPLIRTAIRAALDPDNKTPPAYKEVLPSLLDQATGIGHQVNQIALLFNSGRQTEFEETLSACLQLRDAILTAFKPQEPAVHDHKG